MSLSPTWRTLALASLALGGLSGCDKLTALGLPDFTHSAAKAEADGKAIGAACRQAGRAIEDCYVLNADASKAAIFAGWREMNDYMTQNNIPVVKPELPPPALNKPEPAPAPAAPPAQATAEKPAEAQPADPNADATDQEEAPPRSRRRRTAQ